MATRTARAAAEKSKSSSPKKGKAEAAKPIAPPAEDNGLSWVAAAPGYWVALEGGKLVCKNQKGKRLSSVPKPVASSEASERLHALKEWLDLHDKSCAETVDTWMLRSLPIPRGVIESVWEDSSWRVRLENAVVMAGDAAGYLRGVDPVKGIGVVQLDGETGWLRAAQVAIPHPILLTDLQDLRELAAELGLTQGIAQLFRETFAKPKIDSAQDSRVEDYRDGKFAQLQHALGKSKTLGYRVRGGFATCPVYENGMRVEARFWIGSDSPESESYTGDLIWVDARELTLPLQQVGPVAYSEGIRMASAIYAARVVPAEEAS